MANPASAYSLQAYGTAKVMKVKGTSSYPSGGYDVNIGSVAKVLNPKYPAVGLNDGGTYIALLSGSKVKFIVSATGAEAANATNVSSATVSILIP